MYMYSCVKLVESSVLNAGYFKGAGAGQWEGTKGMSLGVVPDFGPEVLDEQLGMCTVGAVPLVTNYNILTTGLDITACALLLCLMGCLTVTCKSIHKCGSGLV